MIILDSLGPAIKNIELPESKLLGKIVDAPKEYDPSVLVRVPRSQNREQYGITTKDFDGNDLWRCYECSTLTQNGMPAYFMMIIQYNSNSEYIVESKSLKLYLNSFNMTKTTYNKPKDAISNMMSVVKRDLTSLLGVNVSVDYSYNISYTSFFDYKNLEDIVDYSNITNEGYKAEKSILKISYQNDHRVIKWKFEGFRSNCKITNQPDYATVFISYRGEKGVDPVSMVKYLTSFRNENHFHEECCELIHKHIQEIYKPEKLNVSCCYTRRGGIDITPTRMTKKIKPSFDVFSHYTYLDSNMPSKETFDISPERTIYQ